MPNQRPVVLVHGILGFGPGELGPLSYWGSAFHVDSPLERHEASVGPLSSAHDRACELAAQIRGARVDYGKAHAAAAGHARFGYDFTGEGFVPDWGAERPVHLVGHSLGSPTVRCLQHLLATDAWGWGSDARWICSISTLSGVSNGSTLVYFFGVDEQTGLIRPESGVTPLLRMLEVFTSASGAFLDAIYNFDLDHWGFVRGEDESLPDYLRRVGCSDFLWGRDNAPHTLSLQGAYADNAAWPTFPVTYYFAYVTAQTNPGWFTDYHYPSFFMNPAMLALATYIGQKRFAAPPIPLEPWCDEVWWENDGAVSAVSQTRPWVSGVHPVGGECTADTAAERFAPGRWYTQWERGMDHLDICLAPQLTHFGRQRRFYRALFRRLAALDVA